MTKAEAKRWAYGLAADFIRQSWDACDWDEKNGHDGDKLDNAILDVASSLAVRGPKPTDSKPSL